MLDPDTYFPPEAQVETRRQHRAFRAVTRERLAGGCVVYRLVEGIGPGFVRTRTHKRGLALVSMSKQT